MKKLKAFVVAVVICMTFINIVYAGDVSEDLLSVYDSHHYEHTRSDILAVDYLLCGYFEDTEELYRETNFFDDGIGIKDKHEMDMRLQDYINDSCFDKAEKERQENSGKEKADNEEVSEDKEPLKIIGGADEATSIYVTNRGRAIGIATVALPILAILY